VQTVLAGPAAQVSWQATVHRLQRQVPEPSQSASTVQAASQRGVATGFDEQAAQVRPDMARASPVSIRMARVPPKDSIGVFAERVNFDDVKLYR
jgi:hypothetical protein